MVRVNRALLRAPALSLASQVTGVVQLFALLWRHGATNATDTYFYLFNVGNLATQIFTVGVLYPMLLTDERVTRQGARRAGLLVPVAALGAVLLGVVWWQYNGKVTPDLTLAIGLCALNSVLQALLWHRAVAAEAGGTPQWISAVALPANVLATIALFFPWSTSSVAVTAMVAGLVAGNSLFLAAMVSKKVGRHVLDSLPATPAKRHRAHWWFFARAGTGYGGLVIIQSLAAHLPPSALTLLALPTKIVGSVSATFVNSVMPVLVHQDTDSPASARRFIRTVLAVLGVAGVVGVFLTYLFLPSYTVHALVVALWLLASAASAVSQRLAFRFLAPSASRVTLVAVPVVVGAVALSTLSPSFGLIALLCAYAMVDAASSMLLSVSLRDKFVGLVTAAVTASLGAIWLHSLGLVFG